jgi:hypothetical protein
MGCQGISRWYRALHKRVEIDKSRREQHLAQFDAARHLAGKTRADIAHVGTLDDDLAIAQQVMTSVGVGNNPSGGKRGAALRPLAQREISEVRGHVLILYRIGAAAPARSPDLSRGNA